MPDSTLAALDLGSNSFHLVVARLVQGQLHVVDRVKERVRLAQGLTADGDLDEASQGRAFAALEQFEHRLRAVSASRVRVVGTNTLRKARNGPDFVARAEEILKHRVEIISGYEEARLVYQGVSHEVADGGGRRLVVDIGGGSTECIIGEGPQVLRADSLFMGCVSFSERFFPDGVITDDALDRAILAARLELGPVKRIFRGLGWDHCYGSSGTIAAVQEILVANGWADHSVPAEGLRRLRKALRKAGNIKALKLEGLKPERAPVLAGGVAVLSGVFRELHVQEMVASNGALREGVLHDLLGRDGEGDVRELSVRRMRDRFHADPAQADRVENLALRLLAQVDRAWGLGEPRHKQLIRWAAQLREIGLAIANAGYHKHGAYLVQHTEMPGFARGEKSIVAALILGQRRRLRRDAVEALVGRRQVEEVLRLALILRLASRLTRTRSPRPRPWIDVTVGERALRLDFPAGWLEERPLTVADLQSEVRFFAELGYALEWASLS